MKCACGCGQGVPAKGRAKGRQRKWASNRCCQQAKYREYRTFIDGYKVGKGCSRCEISGPAFILDLHHVDPAAKDFELGKGAGKSQARVQRELEKCVVLCANCHRIVEAESRP